MHLTYICIKFNTTSQLLAATYGRPLPHWRAELARRQRPGGWPGLGAQPAQPSPCCLNAYHTYINIRMINYMYLKYIFIYI